MPQMLATNDTLMSSFLSQGLPDNLEEVEW
jgi:hypothetical protein